MHGGGECMAGGCVWLGVMCGEGGCVWQRGACMAKGEVCMVCMPPSVRYGQSMRGRYASYWNAFLVTQLKHDKTYKGPLNLLKIL